MRALWDSFPRPMRGMLMSNSILVELPRDHYLTGEVVSGLVTLSTTRETSTRGLTLDIQGRESTEITTGGGKNSTTYRSHADHVAWRVPLAPEGVVASGLYRFPFQFQIPVYALPSYRGTHAKVEYEATARLDVPWWPDATHSLPFHVSLARESVRAFSSPIRFRSGSGAGGPEIYVEIDGNRFFARELIGCRITLLGLGDARVRRVHARLVGGEWARADGHEATTETNVSEIDIPMGLVRVGEPFTFEMMIPSQVPSSYRGTHSYYSYVLRFGLDIAWAADLIAETPVVIVR